MCKSRSLPVESSTVCPSRSPDVLSCMIQLEKTPLSSIPLHPQGAACVFTCNNVSVSSKCLFPLLHFPSWPLEAGFRLLRLVGDFFLLQKLWWSIPGLSCMWEQEYQHIFQETKNSSVTCLWVTVKKKKKKKVPPLNTVQSEVTGQKLHVLAQRRGFRDLVFNLQLQFLSTKVTQKGERENWFTPCLLEYPGHGEF